MKSRVSLTGILLALLLWATPARADSGVIVRTTLGLSGLQTLCLAQSCTVAGALDGTINQVFLVTTPLNPQTLVNALVLLPGIVDAEVDQLLSLVTTNLVPSPISAALMSDRTPVPYPAGSATMVWNSYANQPAATAVNLPNAQTAFHVNGAGIVADIDTGVDPNHAALQSVLLPGYDFTRGQPGGSEMTDLAPGFPQPNPCDSTTCPAAIQVNQSSAAILDQSSAAILDTNTQYAAFGHGTMVMGVIHLVAPAAQLLPLKAFKSDGTANLSDILRAIYYAGQNNANVINMSFDTTTASTELKNALDYANQLGIICVASAGNDGKQETVYPAALLTDVMGVASVGSTSATDATRSSFSNFGNNIVWVAAPGEEIITTYPFNTYSAGWGTSFSAPFVSGGAALLRSLKTAIAESDAATAMANAAPLTDPLMGHGRLDLVLALQSLSTTSGSPDFSVVAAPQRQSITAGANATFTVSAIPTNGFSQQVTWSCSGAPAGATCTVAPSSVSLDGTHTAAASVTLSTTGKALGFPLALPRASPPLPPWPVLAISLLYLFIVARLYVFNRNRRRLWWLATAAAPAVSLLALSCGGGYGGGGLGSPTLSSLSLNPSSVTSGSSSTGTVTINSPAPNYGVAVSLSSNTTAATVPASVTVATGTTSATFTATATSVSSSTPATITASYAGSSKTAMLTVNPAATPAGTYMITVTGTSGNLTHSTTVQVVVS